MSVTSPERGPNGSNAAPAQPNDRAAIESSGSTLFHWTSEEHDIYQRLLLLHFLGPFHGKYSERQFKETNSKYSVVELRRSFLESISYLCDIEKGGATVTSAALQKLLYSNILWLGANEGIRPNIERFVQSVLDRVKDINHENRETVEKSILHDAVKLAHQRMEFYRIKMVKFSKECRALLKETGLDSQGGRPSH